MTIVAWFVAIILIVAGVTYIVKSQTTITPPTNLGHGGGDTGNGVYNDPTESPIKPGREPKF